MLSSGLIQVDDDDRVKDSKLVHHPIEGESDGVVGNISSE